MKTALFVLILCLTPMLYAGDPAHITVDIVKGLFAGFGAEAGFEQLEDCFDDGGELFYDLIDVVDLLTSDSKHKIIKALKKIGEVFCDFFDIVQHCKELPQDAKEIWEALKKFKSPFKLVVHIGKNIILNGVEVFREIKSAVTAWKNQDFYVFGYNIGAAAYNVLIE